MPLASRFLVGKTAKLAAVSTSLSQASEIDNSHESCCSELEMGDLCLMGEEAEEMTAEQRREYTHTGANRKKQCLFFEISVRDDQKEGEKMSLIGKARREGPLSAKAATNTKIVIDLRDESHFD